MFTTHHLDSHSTTDPKPETLSAVLTGNRISRGIMHVHVHVCRKDDTFRQRRLNHSGVGGGIAFKNNNDNTNNNNNVYFRTNISLQII